MSKTLTAAEKKRDKERKTGRTAGKKATLSLSMPLRKENYLYIAIGVAVIIFSYVLMAIDNSVNGFISLTLCPILLIAAYAWIVFAILYQQKSEAEETVEAPNTN
ncbi:MAG: hypothetical protein RML35_09420 [Chloroherpetonaceae bacterium]|nr:hypothetical protein [Chloroherpetonaceae bacterium]